MNSLLFLLSEFNKANMNFTKDLPKLIKNKITILYFRFIVIAG